MTTLIVKLRGDLPVEEIAGTGDDTGILARLIAGLDATRYPYLAYVDPFGKTTFNRLQMDVVIPELTRLRLEKNADPVRAVIDQIIELANRCSDDVHVYLEFEGD